MLLYYDKVSLLQEGYKQHPYENQPASVVLLALISNTRSNQAAGRGLAGDPQKNYGKRSSTYPRFNARARQGTAVRCTPKCW